MVEELDSALELELSVVEEDDVCGTIGSPEKVILPDRTGWVSTPTFSPQIEPSMPSSL